MLAHLGIAAQPKPTSDTCNPDTKANSEKTLTLTPTLIPLTLFCSVFGDFRRLGATRWNPIAAATPTPIASYP